MVFLVHFLIISLLFLLYHYLPGLYGFLILSLITLGNYSNLIYWFLIWICLVGAEYDILFIISPLILITLPLIQYQILDTSLL